MDLEEKRQRTVYSCWHNSVVSPCWLLSSVVLMQWIGNGVRSCCANQGCTEAIWIVEIALRLGGHWKFQVNTILSSALAQDLSFRRALIWGLYSHHVDGGGGRSEVQSFKFFDHFQIQFFFLLLNCRRCFIYCDIIFLSDMICKHFLLSCSLSPSNGHKSPDLARVK